MRLVTRVLVLAAAMVTATTMLTGCEIGPDREAPISLKRDGQSLIIAVCDDLEATRIAMEERGLSFGDRWSNFWEGEGRVQIEAGDMFSTDNDGGVIFVGETKSNPAMSPNSEIYVVIDYSGGEDSIHRAAFRIGGAGLAESSWLQADGSETTQPCVTGAAK